MTLNGGNNFLVSQNRKRKLWLKGYEKWAVEAQFIESFLPQEITRIKAKKVPQ
jgi:hypothetical protein